MHAQKEIIIPSLSLIIPHKRRITDIYNNIAIKINQISAFKKKILFACVYYLV